MKILMQSRSNFWSLPGGDTVQLTKTREELLKLGIEVELSLELKPDLSGFDLVHLSNLTRVQETYIQMKNAVKQHKRIVLSTIYWPMEEFEKNGQFGMRKWLNDRLTMDQIERVKAIARFITDKNSRDIAARKLIGGSYTKMQREIVENTDIFLPNSEIEMEKLEENMNFHAKRYVVVPNGIDDKAARTAYDSDSREFEKYRDAVICVGRLDTRKNQLNLLRALDGSGYKVILVGSVSKNHRGYFEEIEKLIYRNPEFEYIPHMDNNLIYRLYKVCRVSALPSWLDTPGLVSLEAGVMGCNLVVGTRGSTREYFGQFAEYCEPDDLKSIRKAVDTAFRREKTDELKKFILSRYTWKKAAEETKRAYQMLNQEVEGNG